jgi:hypothetical protein
MTPQRWLFYLVTAIGLITIATGLTQVIAPGFVLGIVGAQSTPATRHFFALIGMFMALFGGALVHAMFARAEQPVVVLWAGLQKIGAVLGVGVGVVNAIFAPVALLVDGFDLLSCIIILAYWKRMETP